MQPISENVYAVTGTSIGRIYVITGKDGLTVVDASYSPKTVDKLAPQFKEIGFGLGDVKNILITHAHPDHVGGLAEMQRQIPNAHTAVHHRDALVMRGEMPLARPRPQDVRGGFWRLMASVMPTSTMPIARVDQELKEGDTLDEILPGLQVVELPGHSPGQVGFWWPEKRLLIGGDVMMHLPWGLAMAIPAFTVDMAEAKRSVRKAADLNPDILLVGHGRPLVGNAAPIIRAFAEKVGV